MAGGYSDFTFESVAARAGTSRPVLYRRWSDRAELLRAAVRRARAIAPLDVVDTGSLRGDIIAALTSANQARAGFAAVLSAQLAGYFRETGTSFSDLRSEMLAERQSGMDLILERAVSRGEIDASKLTPRVRDLPMTLWRHDLLMTLAPVPGEAIEELVDDIWLPLLKARGVLK